MDGINERIKHAESIEEIDELLKLGQAQTNARQRTLNRRKRIAARRKFALRHPIEK